MKTLYIDCGMGAAGDMLTAALLELLPDKDEAVKELNNLGIPNVRFENETVSKCGIFGTHMSVKVDGMEEDEHMHDHHHSHGEDHQHGHEHTHECEEQSHHHKCEEHHHEHDEHHEHKHDHHHECEEHHHDHEGQTHSHEHNSDHTHSHDHGHEGHTHSHHHSSMHDIEHIVRGHLNVSEKVADDVMAIYELIAEAESHAHNKPITEIHFHEVGTMDAIADITAVCLLMNKIAPNQIIVSPVHVGAGQVRCAHGILPVPAPATAFILRDVPIYGGAIKSELCTPTGAAILKHFATKFGDMPVMRTSAIGYGMGKKDFERANCVRVLLGETAAVESTIVELSCNVDDMTAEELGYAMEVFFEAGAVEAYTAPIGMKKSRPGTLLSVMCSEAKKDEIIALIFKHTTTIGIREHISKRYVLDRTIENVSTPLGDVRKKISSGYGVTREKYEYDDIAKLARENGRSIREIREQLK